MIFPVVQLEKTLQINDKTRLLGVESFADKSEAAISLVEIEPEAAAGFVIVTGSSSKDWFLDWVYSGSSRTVTVTVRVTTDGAPVTNTSTIDLLEVVDDNLFSSDGDLTAQEPDILKFITDGRASYLDVHRQAQEQIMAYIDEAGYTDTSGNRLTKDAVLDIDEVNQWSKSLVLQLIYQGLSNAVDDVFDRKAKLYESETQLHKTRLVLRLDRDGDGTLESGEALRFQSLELRRR